MYSKKSLIVASTVLTLLISVVPSPLHATACWTVMVYLDGDNNLEPAAIDDLNEMEAVGSTNKVNVVVQFDRHAEVLKEFKPLQPMEYYLEMGKDFNVLLVPAHPFDYFRHGMGNTIFEYQWAALETFNGSTVFPFSNRRAKKAADILNLPEIGGSDAHTRYGVGLTYTEVEAFTATDLLNQVKKGHTSVGGKHLTMFQFSRRLLKSKIFK